MLCLSTAVILVAVAMAQSNGSNSSYSRFGLGTMNEQSQGFNRGMAGVAQGIQSGQKVNMLNPASYAAIDSLSFIFDAGMGLGFGHFKQGNSSANVRNTSLEHINAGFRLAKGLGMSFGFVPYSTIGYNFTASNRVGSNATSGQSITTQTTYYGNGGLHQMYVGLGWNPFAKLNIGANISYLWGDYNHSLAQQFYEGSTTNTSYNSLNLEWNSDIRTYKIDIGIQYPIRLTTQDWLTLGATTSLGHGIGSEVKLLRYGSVSDSIESNLKNTFEIPYVINAGAAWQHQGRITVATDYTLERWNGCKIPVSYTTATGSGIQVHQYLDRHKASIGAEYIHNPMSRKYTDHIRYRLGASYTTPHIKVNGQDGPSEYSFTAGVAMPLKTTSKSLVNVNLQWLRRAPSSNTMITENYFMLHLGITFNEAWFQKWKIR